MEGKIKFEKVKSDGHYIITNDKNDVLGQLGFNKRWKNWCFYPACVSIGDVWFDATCLTRITRKMLELKQGIS